ncbi:Wall-associated kinase family protein [Rhynchospora pubera]|uniref:Wall-associated kinase family protein n=1 Tax=Rhynchospora pubera TaxID=906938 RepID=A0AAV8BPP8_9POAL|nr:Wall-associated kinase family protein [Rhynchospora pubera]KAJ4789760.1 Wall-associated kinase family protein [Rhynchospora pubera]KAJ4789761.1 Wall-associated kinase family protein [Rhynchospora pubera]
MASLSPLPLLTLLVFLYVPLSAAKASAPISLPDCRSKCGNITVPYPFGIDPGCFRDGFKLTCNESYNPPRLYSREYFFSYLHYKSKDNIVGRTITKEFRKFITIKNISPSGTIHISVIASRFCYNSSSHYEFGTMAVTIFKLYPYINLSSPYHLSTSNNLFIIGCPNQLGYLTDDQGYYVAGCTPDCRASQYSLDATNKSSNGVGSCQVSIPSGVVEYYPDIRVLGNFTTYRKMLNGTTICSYAFVADSNWFHYNKSYLTRTEDFSVQLVLDWAIRNMGNCSYARCNLTDYACRSTNHDCNNSQNGVGYLCSCSKGYQGNPYISGGCQDVNECDLKDEYPCFGNCKNTMGSFVCSCPRGTKGNATMKDGCRKKNIFTFALKIIIGTSVGALFVVLACFGSYILIQKRRLIKTKQRFFEQNGGRILLQQINTTTFKIYSIEELEQATNKFSEECILGRGGHGIVYKGIFEDGTVTAIKKSKLMEEHETNEFAKEIVILSQINHKNVVKLLGCCLEVKVPVLVYEYISNGTLYHYIHDKQKTLISSDVRLRIAVESANALAYMHSFASPPILHGDVKSANILLDDNLIAYVSDFGASKLVPNDVAEIATLVQGTIGYLDPEYITTCQLTDRSDVYSFAVVLLELLTRKKALYLEGPEEDRSLTSSFCKAKKDGRFLEILDAQVRDELKLEVLEEIGNLVMQCLSKNRDERPKMTQVAQRLEMARTL